MGKELEEFNFAMQTRTPPKTEVCARKNSNLELYRIVCMFLIVCHHYVVNSGLIDYLKENPHAPNSVFLYIFGMWGKTAINCFVMITGYFMCKQKTTTAKFIKLVSQIIFYNIIIYSIFSISGFLVYGKHSM